MLDSTRVAPSITAFFLALNDEATIAQMITGALPTLPTLDPGRPQLHRKQPREAALRDP